MRNWKTTGYGIATIVVALGSLAKAILDGDPLTNPDIGATIAAITAGLGLIMAKDAPKPVDPPAPPVG